jgi:hypothetical protein
VLRLVTTLVRAAKRLQSGRLDAYLAYMLIALVARWPWSPYWPDRTIAAETDTPQRKARDPWSRVAGEMPGRRPVLPVPFRNSSRRLTCGFMVSFKRLGGTH